MRSRYEAAIFTCIADIKALTLDKKITQQCVQSCDELTNEHPILKDEIVRVDIAQIKKLASTRWIPDIVINFSLETVGCDITNIKLLYVARNHIHGLGSVDCLLYITCKSNPTRQEFILRDAMAKTILDKLNYLASILPENYVEKYESKFNRRCTAVLDKSFWAPGGQWSIVRAFEKTYDEKIDPMVEKAFIKLLKNLSKDSESIVLDIGGGRGRTAHKLLTLADELEYQLDYTIVEPDRYQCSIAKERLGVDCLPCTVINQTLQEFKDSPEFAKYRGKTKIIISSGGTLNIQVVSYEGAVSSLNIMKELLAADGNIIATGVSPLALTRKEMEGNGFRLFSSLSSVDYKPGQADQLRYQHQLYMMQSKH